MDYFSQSYIFAAVVMLAGVVAPIAYMVMQNKKSLRFLKSG
jgi:hypothetical protein